MLLGSQTQSTNQLTEGIPLEQLLEHLLEFLSDNHGNWQSIKNSLAENSNVQFQVGNGHWEQVEKHGECCKELRTHTFLCNLIKKMTISKTQIKTVDG